MQYSMPYAQPMGGMQGASPFMQAAPGGYGGMQGFASRGQPQPFGQPGGLTMAPQTVNAPLTPKMTGATMADMPQAFQPQSMPLSMTGPPGSQRLQQWPAPQAVLQENPATFTRGGPGREQALEQRVRELESVLLKKDQTIQDLQAQLQGRGGSNKGGKNQVRSPGRGSSGFRKVCESKPIIRYTASDQDDPIDVRLEEFYNSTGSAIQFRRINRGFYRFGDSIVELDIINHKLMARTEDGWNRGKFGPIEKFLMYYENIEREKAGILPES